MTVTNSVISISLTLSILCLGIVCAGESDFQSSIAELKTMVADQQDTIMELKKEVSEITKQEETIQQLKQKLYEQEKRLDKLSLQIQFENSQSQVNIYMKHLMFNMPSNNIIKEMVILTYIPSIYGYQQ